MKNRIGSLTGEECFREKGTGLIRKTGQTFFLLTPLPDSYTAPFLDSSFFIRDHFPLVTVQSLGKGRVLGFFPGNEYTPIHFGFDISGPRFHLGFRIESPNDALESLFF